MIRNMVLFIFMGFYSYLLGAEMRAPVRFGLLKAFERPRVKKYYAEVLAAQHKSPPETTKAPRIAQNLGQATPKNFNIK